jgi:SH3 domain-containing protein
MKRSLFAAAAVLLMSTAAHADMLFTIPPHVSNGVMNMRSGPGVNHGLLGAIPAGETVRASHCAPRDDGVRGANWCLVNWNGMRGWVSQAGLLPYQPPVVAQSPYQAQAAIQPPPLPAPRQDQSSLLCEAPRLVAGNLGPDTNPVVQTDIRYDIRDGYWTVRHIMLNGQIANRDEQYAMNDESNPSVKMLRWTGNFVRDANLYMVGSVEKINGEIVYSETQYRGQALRFQSVARCRVVGG